MRYYNHWWISDQVCWIRGLARMKWRNNNRQNFLFISKVSGGCRFRSHFVSRGISFLLCRFLANFSRKGEVEWPQSRIRFSPSLLPPSLLPPPLSSLPHPYHTERWFNLLIVFFLLKSSSELWRELYVRVKWGLGWNDSSLFSLNTTFLSHFTYFLLYLFEKNGFCRRHFKNLVFSIPVA